jgi:hypothetical protein
VQIVVSILNVLLLFREEMVPRGEVVGEVIREGDKGQQVRGEALTSTLKAPRLNITHATNA